MGNKINIDIKNEIKSIIKRKTEEAYIDFKENWFDQDGIGEYISAIANVCAVLGKSKGFLIWGINDKTRNIVGTNIDYDKDIKGEPFEHYLSRLLSDNAKFEFSECKMENRRIVVLVVYKAKFKPVSYKNERYYRIGSSKVKLSKYPEKEAELWKTLSVGNNTIDNMISPKQDLTFNQLLTYYSSKGLTVNKDTFENTFGLKNDDNKYNMLAYILADNSNIPVRVSIFGGKDKASTLFSVKEFGNMCMLLSLDKVNDFGDTFNIMQADERNRALTRKDVPYYDIKAFREAVINAFVHNKWVDGDAPQIEFYSDRVEILSHGKMPEEQTLDGFFKGQSKPVNKSLSTIFIQLHISEKTGRGVPTIVSIYGKRAFQFNDNSIVVTLPYNKLILENKSDSLNGNISKNIKLNKTQNKILNEMRNNPNVTIFALMAILNLSETTIENNISVLKKRGLIKREGTKKKGYWKIEK